jgi:hypothetical protein
MNAGARSEGVRAPAIGCHETEERGISPCSKVYPITVLIT